MADSAGRFQLYAAKDDIIIAESVGYINKSVPASRLVDTIFLFRKNQVLDTVFVQSKGLSRLMLGFPLDVKPESKFSPWESSYESGQRFQMPDSGTYKLDKIFIPIRKSTGEPEIILHVYELDSANAVGNEVFVKLIRIKKLVNERLVVDCSKEGLYLHNKWGFHISMTWIPDRAKATEGPRLLVSTKSTFDWYARDNTKGPEWRVSKRADLLIGPTFSAELVKLE